MTKKIAEGMDPNQLVERLGIGAEIKRETAKQAYARGNSSFRRFLLEAEFAPGDRAFLAEVFEYLIWDAHGRNRSDRPKSAQPASRPTRKPNGFILPLAQLAVVLGVPSRERKAWVCARLGGIKSETLRKRVDRLPEPDRKKINELIGQIPPARIAGARRAKRPV